MIVFDSKIGFNLKHKAYIIYIAISVEPLKSSMLNKE